VCWFVLTFMESMDAILDQFTRLASPDWCETLRRSLGFSNVCGGLFSCSLTCWLMLRQSLEGSSIEGVWLTVSPELARHFSSGSKRSVSEELSAFAGGYGHARQALPLPIAEGVSDRIHDELRASFAAPECEAYVLDGSSLSPDGSEALRKAYPPCKNQHSESHFPVVKMAVAHDLWTGVAVRPEWGPMYGPLALSEQSLASRLLARLPAKALVVADRNFGVYSVAHEIVGSGRLCLLRLTDQRALSMLGKGVGLGLDQDRPIVWRPTRDDLRAHPELSKDAAIQGRVVVCYVMRAGSAKPVRLCLFVSGTDMPPERLASLYARRWLIETDLRTLKQTLNMARLGSRTVDTLAKDIIFGVCAYNLVRALAAAAGSLLKVPARQISFTRMAACAQAYAPRLQAEIDPVKRALLVEEMLARAGARKLKPRNRPSPNRQAWARRTKFPKRLVVEEAKN
jgi:hypothetical protein